LRDYRGSYFVVDRSKKERRSRDTNNFYTALIDILPSWSEYPKRSYSVIALAASIGISYYDVQTLTEDYGKYCYRVFPKNGAKIAVANSSDAFTSFSNLDKRLRTGIATWTDEFPASMNKCLEKLDVQGHEESYMYSLSDITGVIEKWQKYITKDVFLDYLKNNRGWNCEPKIHEIRIKDIEDNFHGDWMDYLNDLLDPSKNGFSLIGVDNLNSCPSISSRSLEVWTDSHCLLIPVY
jgi:hypothetical protein